MGAGGGGGGGGGGWGLGGGGKCLSDTEKSDAETNIKVDNVKAALIMGLIEAQQYIFSTYLYQRFKEIIARCW